MSMQSNSTECRINSIFSELRWLMDVQIVQMLFSVRRIVSVLLVRLTTSLNANSWTFSLVCYFEYLLLALQAKTDFCCIAGSGMSILCFIALRMITKYDDVLKAIENGRKVIKELCSHSHRREGKDYLQRTVMSAFLLRILQKSDYFGRRTSQSGDFWIFQRIW